MILLSLVCIKYLISKSKEYINENGKSSMGAVVEQIQQTYDLQVSGYYSQLQLAVVPTHLKIIGLLYLFNNSSHTAFSIFVDIFLRLTYKILDTN